MPRGILYLIRALGGTVSYTPEIEPSEDLPGRWDFSEPVRLYKRGKIESTSQMAITSSYSHSYLFSNFLFLLLIHVLVSYPQSVKQIHLLIWGLKESRTSQCVVQVTPLSPKLAPSSSCSVSMISREAQVSVYQDFVQYYIYNLFLFKILYLRKNFTTHLHSYGHQRR